MGRHCDCFQVCLVTYWVRVLEPEQTTTYCRLLKKKQWGLRFKEEKGGGERKRGKKHTHTKSASWNEMSPPN